MIAKGLCIMGGAFAQDASSLTVDTYWPVERVLIDTGIENIVIAEASIKGGDSLHDDLSITYQESVLNASFLIVGLRNPDTREGLVIFQSAVGLGNILAQKSGNSATWREQLGEKYTWFARNGSYKRGEDMGILEPYSLENKRVRQYRIGSALSENERYFYNSSYSNGSTGQKAQWIPMKSFSGYAFFEPVSLILAEQ